MKKMIFVAFLMSSSIFADAQYHFSLDGIYIIAQSKQKTVVSEKIESVYSLDYDSLIITLPTVTDKSVLFDYYPGPVTYQFMVDKYRSKEENTIRLIPINGGKFDPYGDTTDFIRKAYLDTATSNHRFVMDDYDLLIFPYSYEE